MATFTVRVELHDASGSDYTDLHKAMNAHGFFMVVLDDDGHVYELPTAEYSFTHDNYNDPFAVRDVALSIARSVRSSPDPWVMVTMAAGKRALATRRMR